MRDWVNLGVVCWANKALIEVWVGVSIETLGWFLLDAWIAGVGFWLEFIETGSMGGFENVFFHWSGVWTSIHAFIVHYSTCALLLIVIDSALKQHLHSRDIIGISLSFWGLVKIIVIDVTFFMLIFLMKLKIMTALKIVVIINFTAVAYTHHIIQNKRILNEYFSLADNGLIELVEVDRSLVECSDRFESFHFLVVEQGWASSGKLFRIVFVAICIGCHFLYSRGRKCL